MRTEITFHMLVVYDSIFIYFNKLTRPWKEWIIKISDKQARLLSFFNNLSGSAWGLIELLLFFLLFLINNLGLSNSWGNLKWGVFNCAHLGLCCFSLLVSLLPISLVSVTARSVFTFLIFTNFYFSFAFRFYLNFCLLINLQCIFRSFRAIIRYLIPLCIPWTILQHL